MHASSNHLHLSDSDRFCTLWMMWKSWQVHWRALLAGEEGWWRSPYGCVKPLQKVARQKAFSWKGRSFRSQEVKATWLCHLSPTYLWRICYWLSEPEWGGKSQIPTSEGLTNTNDSANVFVWWYLGNQVRSYFSTVNFSRWGNIS